MRRAEARHVDIDGPVGILEALLELPERPSTALAVVCHPHPLHGGTMTNKVVYTLARSFQQLGVASLKFNFRGVGRSAGRHADGEGEIDDALHAAHWALAEGYDQLFLAGFSFGALVALRVSPQLDPCGLVTVAPPVARAPADLVVPSCPWLVVHGELDELVPLQSAREWSASLRPAPEFAVVNGATHFFHGALRDLGARVTGFVEPLVRGETGGERALRADPVNGRGGTE